MEARMVVSIWYVADWDMDDEGNEFPYEFISFVPAHDSERVELPPSAGREALELNGEIGPEVQSVLDAHFRAKHRAEEQARYLARK
jgi:hypothetical protein